MRQTARTTNVATSLSGTETAQTTTEIRDSLGRLVSVSEPSGSSGANVTTTYGYDIGDHLVSTSTTSGVTQARSFVYDGRGFLVSEQHPEKGASGDGTTNYLVTRNSVTTGYDARGHAHRKLDGSVDGAFDITYTYDFAERLTRIEAPYPASGSTPKALRTIKQFTFATANNPASCTDTSAGACDATLGKLQTASRHNYNVSIGGDATVTDTYQYKGLGGLVSQRDTTVGSGGNFTGATFRASQAWNDLGLVTTLNYPARCTDANCTITDLRTVTNSYTNTLLSGVTGFATGITYQANGLIDTVTHANSVNERWIGDVNGMARPCAIFAYGSGVTLASGSGGQYAACGYSLTGNGTIQWGSGAYAFDGAGNVKTTGGKSYTYDGVSRLAGANNGESHTTCRNA